MSYPPHGSPTPSYPGPGYPPPGGGFQQQPPKSKTPILIGIIVGLALVIAALGVFVLLNRDDDGSDDPTTAVTQSTQSSEPPSTQPPITPETSPPPPPITQNPSTAAPQPSVVTVTAPAPVTTTVPAPAPPPPPAPAWPPSGASLCDSYVAVNDVTSCSFAYLVLDTYYNLGPGNYDVYSPVTGNYHNMTCGAQTANIVYCYGGTNAEVWFRQ